MPLGRLLDLCWITSQKPAEVENILLVSGISSFPLPALENIGGSSVDSVAVAKCCCARFDSCQKDQYLRVDIKSFAV